MKRILITVMLGLLYWSTDAADIYVATSGNDATGNGSLGSPYASLSKALTVATYGTKINVAYGTYTSSVQLNVPVGVSIDGGDSSKTTLVFTYTTTDANSGGLTLKSEDGTFGNQTISNIALDGANLTARGGICVQGRSNVKILYVSVRNFAAMGIYINGSSHNTKPVVRCTGNEVAFSKINNCADRQYVPISIGANLIITGYSGLLVHDNIFIQQSRGFNHNGNIVSATGIGHSDGLKYYNNKSYKNVVDGDVNHFSFHLEMWDAQGGMEFYNNEFHGGVQQIDFGGTTGKVKGSYPYSISIHDNLFIMDTVINALAGGAIPLAINFEGKVYDALVYNNHFKNMPFGVVFSMSQIDVGPPTISNVKIYRNYFENGGFPNGDFAFDMRVSPGYGATLRDIFIYNNTISTRSRAALSIATGPDDQVRNVRMSNNIITGVVRYGWTAFDGTGQKDSIFLQNNLLYNNAGSNGIYYLNGATAPTNFFNTGNKIGNPLLNPDLTLKPGSPAINTGIDVGLPFLGVAPDIGAYETGVPNIPPTIDIGPDQIIYINSTTLSANVTPTPGQSITYSWTGDPTITGSTTLTPSLSNLTPGNHIYTLTATQPDGQVVSDALRVTYLLPNVGKVDYMINRRKKTYINF